jgi:hypothetical protein
MGSMVPIHDFKKNTAIICQITEPIRHESANNRYGDRYYVTHIRLPKGDDHKLIVGVVMRRALEASYDNRVTSGGSTFTNMHPRRASDT